MAILEIVFPLSLIFCTIHMNVNTLSIGFVIPPLPLVDVSVYVPELAMAACFVILPLALVTSPVRP